MTAPLAWIEKPATLEAPVERRARTIWSILTSLTSGGAEMLVAGLNRHFVRNGWQHRVVVLCDAREIGNSAETENWLRARIEKEGGSFSSLGLGRSRNPFSGGSAINRLMGEVQPPDVIHTHTARAVPMLALSRLRSPVCMTHHNSRLTFPRQLFRVLDTLVDEYVAISPETAQIYARSSRRPIATIANGPDDRFLCSQPRQQTSRPVRILSVGAISDQKNYDLLLQVARQMVDLKSIGASFRIAGGGDGLSRLQAQSADLPVEFLGERKDIPALLDEADIFLNTSLFEGQSVAILEAWAKGLPVIATDVPGNRDLINDGENGFLCPANDAKTLAAAIGKLIEHPTTYRKLSAGALESGRRFSIAETARKHLALYARLAGLDA